MDEWIISSSVLIAVVAALRFILRSKISLRLQYVLWALVLIRLLIPVHFGASSVSVMNAVPDAPPETLLSTGVPAGAYTPTEGVSPELSSLPYRKAPVWVQLFRLVYPMCLSTSLTGGSLRWPFGLSALSSWACSCLLRISASLSS